MIGDSVYNKYNLLSLTTTIIKFENKKKEHATGFFYNYNNNTYLVTNRHVLEHQHDQPKEISIYLRNDQDITDYRRLDLPLYDDEFPRWLIFPGLPSVDIAILPVGRKLSDITTSEPQTGSRALSAEQLPREDYFIESGQATRGVGYPRGYIDKDAYFPVTRIGMISTPYGHWFDGKPQFLIDSVMGQGMSGSPIYITDKIGYKTADGSIQVKGPKTILLGVHSGNYNVMPQDEEMNIGHAWYPILIELIFILNGIVDFVDTVDLDLNRWYIDDTNLNRIAVSKYFINSSDDWQRFDPEHPMNLWEKFDPEQSFGGTSSRTQSPEERIMNHQDILEKIESILDILSSDPQD